MREARLPHEPERPRRDLKIEVALSRAEKEAIESEALARRQTRVWGRAGETWSNAAVVRDCVRTYLASGLALTYSGGSAPILGEQLRDAREKYDMTLADLAERSRVSVSVLCRLERGERQPSVAHLRAIAEALDLSIVIDPTGATVVRR